MEVRTHGLLAEIKSKTWRTGDAVVSWAELNSFMARFGQADTRKAVQEWAGENMMWVEFQRDASGEITHVLFGASK